MPQGTFADDYPFQPVPFTNVRLSDTFWSVRIETNRTETIPFAFRKCEETGRIENFEKAAGINPDRTYKGTPFDDTDVYKTIEGAAYALSVHPDPKLEEYIDKLAETIARAQEPDGYLYTNRTVCPDNPHEWAGTKRWEKEAELSHELYNLGHFFEGAVAYFQATGKRKLLDVALKAADLLDRDFGPGRNTTAPGHQEVELALVKLYRITKDPRHLKLARFFLDTRGPGGSEYSQAHKRLVEQDEAIGHAVRATYMYSGMADVAALTGDAGYLAASQSIWRDVAFRKLYVTGGIGARHSAESFGDAYELPNMSAYCETCASIANVFWNHRLFMLQGDARYIDVLERTLYNALLSGVALDGKSFFYPNPLLSMGQHARSPWFGCSCCPSNIARFIPSVPGYIYAQRDRTAYVNLFVQSEASLDLSGTKTRISQKTGYPWSGDVVLRLEPETQAELTLAVHIPGWARNQPVPSDLYRYRESAVDESNGSVTLSVNGVSRTVETVNGYAEIRRTWHAGDEVRLHLPMPVRRIEAHEKVEDDRGMIALERGPIVYCLEWPDQPSRRALNLMLDDRAALNVESRLDLLGGVKVITGTAKSLRQREDGGTDIKHGEPFTAIPYYAWAHRGAGEMTVWIPRDLASARPLPLPSIASRSTVKVSGDLRTTMALHDRLTPKSSNDHSMPFMHWWPRMGTQEWVEYHFANAEEVQRVEVYWFDDGPWGGCRVPASWTLKYLSGGEWKPVGSPGHFGVAKDTFNVATFAPVETTALRIEVQLQKDVSGGMLEWVVK